jgi:hypothetical protein
MPLNRNFLVLGVGLVCVTTLICFFPSQSKQDISTPVAALNASPTITSAVTPTKIPTESNNEMQQIINSGQMSPPPGNTGSMDSAKWPFVRTQRPAETVMPTEGQSQLNIASSAQRVDSPKPVGQRGATQSPINSGNSKSDPTPREPVEFETPPGIGSALGGN